MALNRHKHNKIPFFSPKGKQCLGQRTKPSAEAKKEAHVAKHTFCIFQNILSFIKTCLAIFSVKYLRNTNIYSIFKSQQQSGSINRPGLVGALLLTTVLLTNSLTDNHPFKSRIRENSEPLDMCGQKHGKKKYCKILPTKIRRRRRSTFQKKIWKIWKRGPIFVGPPALARGTGQQSLYFFLQNGATKKSFGFLGCNHCIKTLF